MRLRLVSCLVNILPSRDMRFVMVHIYHDVVLMQLFVCFAIPAYVTLTFALQFTPRQLPEYPHAVHWLEV